MKKLILTVFVLTAAASVFAQGSVSFSQRNSLGTTHVWGPLVTSAPGPVITNITLNANNSVTLYCAPGAVGLTARILAATNLASPILWQAIFTNINTGDTWQFTDTNAIRYPARYYRIMLVL